MMLLEHESPALEFQSEISTSSEVESARALFDTQTRPLIRHLLSHARSILHSEDLAWDAVQEALLGLWRKVRQGDTILDYAGPWLCRAVVLRSLQILRQNGRRGRHERNAAACRQELVTLSPHQHGCACAEEDRQIIALALTALPDDYRLVMTLRLERGLDYAAVARELGLPVGTVRSRLNRARKLLQTILNSSICHEPINGRCGR